MSKFLAPSIINWWDIVFKTYRPNQWFIQEELNQVISAKSYQDI